MSIYSAKVSDESVLVPTRRRGSDILIDKLSLNYPASNEQNERAEQYKSFNADQPTSTSIELGLSTDEIPKKKESAFNFGAKPSDPETKIRDDPIAQSIASVLDSNFVAAIGVVATFITLFAYSFNVAFLPSSLDLPTAIILLLCFVFFFLEFICQLIARDNYFLSFFFWMDLVGTASIIFDINPLSGWFYANDILVNEIGTNYFSKTATTLKVARLSRVVRVVRIVRIFRILKSFLLGEQTGDKHPSKFGNQLTTIMIQRLIVCVFIFVIIVPLLVASSETGLSRLEGLDAIETIWTYAYGVSAYSIAAAATRDYSIVVHSNYTLVTTTLRAIQTNYIDYNSNIISLDVFGYPIINGTIAGYRSMELGIWKTPSSHAIFSLKDESYQTAGFDLLLTLIIIIVLLIWSGLIKNDIAAFVTQPIDRMTAIIKKLASTVCFLNDDAENATEDAYETDVIENLLANLAGAFSVGGEKKTRRRSSTLNYSLSGISTDNTDKEDDDREPEDYPELKSMDVILTNEDVIPHFRAYMTASFCLESFIFYQEVIRYRSLVENAGQRIYKTFISPSASQQVNIPNSMITKIENTISVPSMSTFDEAKTEIFNLLKTNNYYPFLQSKYCAAFLEERKKKRIAKALEFSKLQSSNP